MSGRPPGTNGSPAKETSDWRCRRRVIMSLALEQTEVTEQRFCTEQQSNRGQTEQIASDGLLCECGRARMRALG
jgi:hypothetical protein